MKGAFDTQAGGEINLALSADRTGAKGFVADRAELKTALMLEEDGALSLLGGYEGDAITPFGPVHDLDVVIHGEGRSWKEALDGAYDQLTGAFTLAVESARAQSSEVNALSPLTTARSALVFGEPVSSLDFSFATELRYENVGYTARLVDPLRMQTNTGARLSITEQEGKPLAASAGGGSTLRRRDIRVKRRGGIGLWQVRSGKNQPRLAFLRAS